MSDRKLAETKLKKPEDVSMLINNDGEVVVMHFPDHELKLGIPPETAVKMALALIRHAEAVDNSDFDRGVTHG